MSIKKIFLYISILFLFTLIFIKVDHHVFEENRKQAFLSHSILSLEKDMKQFESSTVKDILSGDWNKYFYLKYISETALNNIVEGINNIKNIAIYNRRFHLYAQTGKNIPLKKITPFLKRVKKNKTFTTFIYNNTFNYLIPGKNDSNKIKGYILIEYKLSALKNSDILFFTDIAKENFIILPENIISTVELKKLKKLLLNSSSNNFRIQLNDKLYQLYYKFYANRNIYFGIIETPSFITTGFHSILLYLSFFLVIITGFLSLPNIKEKLTQEKKKQKITQLLQEQKKSLKNINKEINNLEQISYTSWDIKPIEKEVDIEIIEDSNKINPPNTSEKEIDTTKEKIQTSKTIKKNETLQESKEGTKSSKKNNKAPIYTYQELDSKEKENKQENIHTIELKPLKREFIFLDPLDESWKKTTINEKKKENNKITEIRKKTFTKEVKDLIQDIETNRERNYDKIFEKISSFQNKYKNQQRDNFKSDLNEVYFDDVTINEVETLLSYINKKFNADGVLLLNYNYFLGCYKTEIQYNLSDDILDTFYALNNDYIIHLKKNKAVYKEIDRKLRQNIFFRKRFPRKILVKLRSYLILPLHKYFFDGFIIILYNKRQADKIIKKIPQKEINHYMHETSPAFKSFFMEKRKFDLVNQNEDLIKELKFITDSGLKIAYICQIQFNESINHKKWLQMKKEFKILLFDDERIIYNSPHLFYVFLKTDKSKLIKHHFLENNIKIQCKILKFPDEGQSLYNYL